MDGVVLQVVAGLAEAAPPALVLLVGLVAAVFVARKSKVAAVFLVLGVLDLGFGLLLDVGLRPGLMSAGVEGPLVLAGATMVTALVHGFGLLLVLVGACVGPAPAREEEEF